MPTYKLSLFRRDIVNELKNHYACQTMKFQKISKLTLFFVRAFLEYQKVKFYRLIRDRKVKAFSGNEPVDMY